MKSEAALSTQLTTPWFVSSASTSLNPRLVQLPISLTFGCLTDISNLACPKLWSDFPPSLPTHSSYSFPSQTWQLHHLICTGRKPSLLPFSKTPYPIYQHIQKAHLYINPPAPTVAFTTSISHVGYTLAPSCAPPPLLAPCSLFWMQNPEAFWCNASQISHPCQDPSMASYFIQSKRPYTLSYTGLNSPPPHSLTLP